MTTTPLEYWKPDGEERRLRVFISHRYGQDAALYDEVIAALHRELFGVQDISLSAGQILRGPRGGALPRLEIQAEIAARIYTSDVLIAPSRPAVSNSHWVTWEVQLAAVGYGIPILFVNHRGLKRKTRLVSEIEDLGLPHAVCEPETQKIVFNVMQLVGGRPTWAMREEETDKAIRYRGPPRAAQDEVRRKLPFQPRLVEPPNDDPPPKPGFWAKLTGRDRHL